jgi:hypothetical protein
MRHGSPFFVGVVRVEMIIAGARCEYAAFYRTEVQDIDRLPDPAL